MLSDSELRDTRERVKKALVGAGTTPYLYGYDVAGIQSFIAARGKPQAMHGASCFVKGVDTHNQGLPLAIFSGGGRGMGLARSEEDARQYCEALRQNLGKGGALATAFVPFEAKSEQNSLRWLRLQLEQAKETLQPPAGELPDSKEHQCATCSQFEGTDDVTFGDQPLRVCKLCRRATEHTRATNPKMRQSLSELSDRGWIAAVSGDGNSMGRFFDSLRTLDEYALASTAIARVFESAHKAAVAEVFQSRDNYVPLITGGDDIRIFVAIEDVIGYVSALVKHIEANAEKASVALRNALLHDAVAQLRELGIGIGVAVAPDKYPARLLLDHAHDLELSAKTICQKNPPSGKPAARSALDLEVLTSQDAFINGLPKRSNGDSRPFTRVRWQDVCKCAKALREVVPPTQVAALAAATTTDDAEFRNLFRYQVARNKEWQRYFEAVDVNWRSGAELDNHRPDPGLLALYRIVSKREARP